MTFTGNTRSTFTNRLKNNPVIFIGFDGQGSDEQSRCARAAHLVAHHGDNRLDSFIATQSHEFLMKQLIGTPAPPFSCSYGIAAGRPTAIFTMANCPYPPLR